MNNQYVKTFQNQTDNWKDKVQYCVATTSFLAGIGMGFLSFITQGTVSGEILGFIGECFTLTGGIFGVTLYVRNKVAQAGSYVIEQTKQIFDQHEREYHRNDKDDNSLDDQAQ